MVIKVLWLTAIWCQLTRAAAVSGHHIKLLFQSRKSSTLVTMHMTLAALAVAVNTAALCCQRLQAFLFCFACAQQQGISWATPAQERPAAKAARPQCPPRAHTRARAGITPMPTTEPSGAPEPVELAVRSASEAAAHVAAEVDGATPADIAAAASAAAIAAAQELALGRVEDAAPPE